MDEMKLVKIQQVIQAAKQQIRELYPDLDFTLDLSIQADDINHVLAVQARDLNYKPQRHDASAWYEKTDEYGGISVFVE